jgi:hypothetical protein
MSGHQRPRLIAYPGSTGRKAPPQAWKPGQSGNPSGRPKLSPDKKVALLNAIGGNPVAVALAKSIVHDAMHDPDVKIRYRARELLAPRLWAAAQSDPLPEPLVLPALSSLENCQVALATIACETAAGRLSMENAAGLSAVIKTAVDSFVRAEVSALQQELAELRELAGALNVRRHQTPVGHA